MQQGIQDLPQNEIRTSQNDLLPANTKSYFLLLSLLYIGTRIVFCILNAAEFTDAYIIFTWTGTTSQKWHPLYPVLIKILMTIVSDPIWAGRIISVLCGGIAVITLWRLTADIYDVDTANICAILLIASPQFLWTNTRVFTESLYVAISVSIILFTYRAIRANKFSDALLSIFLSGLAVLTRPDGIIFLPCALWALIHVFKVNKPQLRTLMLLIPALSSWLIFLIWFKGRDTESTYEGVLLFNLMSSSLSRIFLFFTTYIENYPYALTYPIFIAALIAIFWGPLNPSRRIWLIILAYLHLAVFGMVSIHGWWSSRFLILLLVFALPESALFFVILKTKVNKLTWSIATLGAILFSFLFAFVGNYLQKDTYKDVKESAIFIRDQFPTMRVYSDETYKVPFYLRHDVTRYSSAQSFQEGDILVLHSFHTPLQPELAKLSATYDLRPRYVARGRTMPVLTNSLLESIEFNGQPITILKRFEWQRFESIVIQIGKRKNSTSS
jgi:hypothetical protein